MFNFSYCYYCYYYFIIVVVCLGLQQHITNACFINKHVTTLHCFLFSSMFCKYTFCSSYQLTVEHPGCCLVITVILTCHECSQSYEKISVLVIKKYPKQKMESKWHNSLSITSLTNTLIIWSLPFELKLPLSMTVPYSFHFK